VQYAGIVCSGQPTARFYDHGEPARPVGGRLGRTRSQHGSERCPVDELHREKQLPVGLTGVVDGDDRAMRQLRHGPCFSQQACGCIVRASERGMNDLDRDLAFELRIIRRPHHTHRACADHVDQPVAADHRAWEQADSRRRRFIRA
jgi:hypothetical protein